MFLVDSKRLLDVEQKFKLAGVIALNISADGKHPLILLEILLIEFKHPGVLHFSWGHTTESMCIGYLTSYHKEPTVS